MEVGAPPKKINLNLTVTAEKKKTNWKLTMNPLILYDVM